MKPCSQVQLVLLECEDAHGALSPELQAHLNTCVSCQEFAGRRKRLAELTSIARTTLIQDYSFSPAVWARVRTQVMAGEEPLEGWGAALFHLFPVAAIPVFLMVLGWALFFGASGDTQEAQAPRWALAPSVQPQLASTDTQGKLITGQAKAINLAGGGHITTGEEAIQVATPGGHTLIVSPQSRLELTEWSPEAISIELKQGAITSQVRPLTGHQKYHVTGAGHRVAVLGTVFTVRHEPGKALKVDVDEGRVWVAQGNAPRTTLSAGENWSQRLAAPTSPDAVPTTRVDTPVAKEQPRRTKRRRKTGQRHARKAPTGTTPKALPEQPSGKPVTEEASKAPKTQPVGPVPPGKQSVKVIQIQVPDSKMKGLPTSGQSVSLRDRLARVIGVIRGGQCKRALSMLRKISRELQLRSPPTDLLYLMGYCLHRTGNKKRSMAIFRAYRRVTRSKRWTLPKHEDQVLPLPRVGQLAR